MPGFAVTIESSIVDDVVVVTTLLPLLFVVVIDPSVVITTIVVSVVTESNVIIVLVTVNCDVAVIDVRSIVLVIEEAVDVGLVVTPQNGPPPGPLHTQFDGQADYKIEGIFVLSKIKENN